SIASISSSSGARSRFGSADVVISWGKRASSSPSFRRGRSVDIGYDSRCAAAEPSGPRRLERKRGAFGDERREPALALLDGVVDLLGVARALLAHLRDDLARALLEVDDGVDELFHGLGADRRPVAGLER